MDEILTLVVAGAALEHPAHVALPAGDGQQRPGPAARGAVDHPDHRGQVEPQRQPCGVAVAAAGVDHDRGGPGDATSHPGVVSWAIKISPARRLGSSAALET